MYLKQWGFGVQWGGIVQFELTVAKRMRIRNYLISGVAKPGLPAPLLEIANKGILLGSFPSPPLPPTLAIRCPTDPLGYLSL